MVCIQIRKHTLHTCEMFFSCRLSLQHAECDVSHMIYALKPACIYSNSPVRSIDILLIQDHCHQNGLLRGHFLICRNSTFPPTRSQVRTRRHQMMLLLSNDCDTRAMSGCLKVQGADKCLLNLHAAVLHPIYSRRQLILQDMLGEKFTVPEVVGYLVHGACVLCNETDVTLVSWQAWQGHAQSRHVPKLCF